MNKSIKRKFKRNILILSIVVTATFFIINISLYILNNNFLINKVEDENQAFMEITTHILNENEISVALEYIEHYTHIHEVNIEVVDNNNVMLFSSEIAHKYTSQYKIQTEKGEFKIFIDNTDSITVNRIEKNTLYVNVTLLIIYLISIIVLVKMNRTSLEQINKDIGNVLKLIDDTKTHRESFYFTEFELIYKTIDKYLENIDLLTEQKEMNMKGIAHDIKTPLTIIYSFFERTMDEQKISLKDKEIAFEASKKVNELLNDIIENNKISYKQEINLSSLINEKLKQYKSIFENKNINIEPNIEKDIFLECFEKDISRVLDNIISNAYYYSKHDSTLNVTLELDEQYKIDFTSTPEDIGSFDVSTIFNKGYRGENSENSNNYGKGMGLYLCRLLLDNIGGKINATKENENVKITINL